MKTLYKILGATLISFGMLSASAQTTHQVAVGNFFFEPATLTIQLGDIVVWTNQQGMHNVSTETFPDNPNSFGNAVAPAPWVYEFTFTELGTNSYVCSPHPGPMQGTITVEDGSLSAFDAGEKVSFTVFPNPVSDVLKWKWNRDVAPTKADFKLYDLTGQIAAEFSMLRVGEYDVRGFPAGVYHYQVDQGEGKLHTGKLFIQRR